MKLELEHEYEELLQRLETPLRQFMDEEITTTDFLRCYGSPIDEYALDGHESSSEEQRLFRALEPRLRIHREIADKVLRYLCTDLQAEDPAYAKAGRISSRDDRLALIAIAEAHEITSVRDWRLHGQGSYLRDKQFILKQYTQYRDDWDHDHCVFCSIKLMPEPPLPDAIASGYPTDEDYYWVCPKCFEDFRVRFN